MRLPLEWNTLIFGPLLHLSVPCAAGIRHSRGAESIGYESSIVWPGDAQSLEYTSKMRINMRETGKLLISIVIAACTFFDRKK